MAPSMQIDNVRVTNYEDLDALVKRATIEFSSSELITFSGGETAAVRLGNVALPVLSSDVANKRYVDAAILGLSFKTPARVVALGNVTVATDLVVGGTVDGVTLAAGDRVLVAGQTAGVENGIYVVAAGAPVRADDLPAGSGASGTYLFVDEGATYRDRAYVCTSDRGSDVVGTHALAWVQFSSRSSAMAGQGLVTGAAEQLDVNVDNSTLTITGDVVQVKDLGIVNAKLANATIANAKLQNPSLQVQAARGLTTTGATIALGGSSTLGVDHTVVPDLAAANTFTGSGNTFSGALTVTPGNATTLGGTLAVAGSATVGGTATVTGTVTAPRVTGLADPTAAADAVNLGFVTLAINNATQGGAARVTTMGANVALTMLSAGLAVDGIQLVAGTGCWWRRRRTGRQKGCTL